jgi:pimeloyl-ACP methyl ester carboxylesterase
VLIRPLKKRITELNKSLPIEATITLPSSACTSALLTISAPLRIITVVFRVIFLLPTYLIAALFFKNANSDPKKITNNKTPILLIHGSGACQRQWDIFRLFIQGKDVGHVFSLNLNKSAFVNDKTNINNYAEKQIAEKINEMKKLYENAGYKMDEVVLVGHSMGGLVAGAYSTTQEEKTGVKVKALVAINSPWSGSPLADVFLSEKTIPDNAFRTNSQYTKELREAVIKKSFKDKEFKLYTVNSHLDPLVSVSSSSLEIAPSHQMYRYLHDHFTSMLDFNLARKIRQEWIAVNTKDLKALE